MQARLNIEIESDEDFELVLRPVPAGVKKCSRCGLLVHVSEFSIGGGADGLDSRCRSCKKWDMRRDKYNITKEEFEFKLKQQDYRCAICKTDTPPTHANLKTMVGL